MSDGFNPYQPQTAGQDSALVPDQRPVTATVFGILNLVFGILGVCGNIAGVGMFAFMSSNLIDAKMKAEMNLQQFDDPVYFGILSAQMVLTGILSVVIIVSGIGLLKFKPWGRKLANFYAVAYLILLVVGTVVNVIYSVIPAVNDAYDPNATPDQIGGAIGGVVGGVFGVCFGMAYPICILIFLNRRRFVDQIMAR
ncbi:MAG: hypothetical protein SFV81_22820 [Pirellulaceae bacterium]|nr:hypothetical protein [Pirellulaceae bacterium]